MVKLASVAYRLGAVKIIRGPHTDVRRGPFSHKRSQDFLFWCTFSAKKVDDFLVVVMFKPTLNVQTFKRRNSMVNLPADRGPPGGGGVSHGTTAQWVMRPC